MQEVNFDGLVGPTHNYGGLSLGNLASSRNAGAVSRPRQAALQGLAKMRHLMALGIPQGVLPPHERPQDRVLRGLGFSGTTAEMVDACYRASPVLLANLMSASAMWTANAATVSPATDTRDSRTHLTVANLGTMFHRSLEAEQTFRTLSAIFPDPQRFAVHEAVPYGGGFGDEGAANHGRFCAAHGDIGAELFVYGRSAFDRLEGRRFPPRQALEASQAIARTHGLDERRTIYVLQSREAIEAGAFHNDVVAVANGSVQFYHEQAFEDRDGMQAAVRAACSFDPVFVEVPANRVSLDDAIRSYLFNSQLVSLPDGAGMALILPQDAESNPNTKSYVADLLDMDNPIVRADYFDLRESMQNGGGPACLRLRVALSLDDQQRLGGAVLMTEERISALEAWVKRHYREELAPDDLRDPLLVDETRAALDDLTGLLELGPLYDFQRCPS